MPPRTHALSDADRHAAWLRAETGRELRLARHNAGATMRAAAERLGWSKSKVSRIERGLSARVSVRDVTLLAAVVGLRPSLKLFPSGRPLRDVGQVELLAALNRRMHPAWKSTHEVPMPTPGDLRALDQLSVLSGCRVAVEAYRRFTDYQAQTRSARAKQAEVGAHRLLILIEDTATNRRALAAVGAELRRSFPISQRAALAALAAARDPGGDSIVVLRRLSGAGRPPPLSRDDTNLGRAVVASAPVAPGATHSG